MAMLSREILLKKQKLVIEKVELKIGDDGFVHVRSLYAGERDAFENSLLKEVKTPGGDVDYVRDQEHFRAKLAVRCVCEEDGTAVFHPKDVKALSESMSALTMERIIKVAQRLNNITEESKEAKVKNSSGAQSAASISD